MGLSVLEEAEKREPGGFVRESPVRHYSQAQVLRSLLQVFVGQLLHTALEGANGLLFQAISLWMVGGGGDVIEPPSLTLCLKDVTSVGWPVVSED